MGAVCIALNNYIPVIIDPLYYAGLVVLAIAIAIAALRLVLAFPLAHWPAAAAGGRGHRRRGRRTSPPWSPLPWVLPGWPAVLTSPSTNT